MKKIFLLFLCFVFLFCGCVREESVTEKETTYPKKSETTGEAFTGIWLTYSELSVKGKNYTENSYKAYISELFTAFSNRGINNVFIHVRPFSDALYYSELFESSE